MIIDIIRILFILFFIWGFYLKLEQVYHNLKEFYQNFKTKTNEEDSKNEDNADENNTLNIFIFYALFAIFLEILLHIIIVYYFPKDMLICNWQTVYIFFENAACVNNTIGFAYYIFHPIITIFFTWIVFISMKHNLKYISSKFPKEEITTKLYILEMLFFLFWIFFSNYIIYFNNPYGGGELAPNPKIWITEFIFGDATLLLMNYLGIVMCIVITLAFIRQNEKNF